MTASNVLQHLDHPMLRPFLLLVLPLLAALLCLRRPAPCPQPPFLLCQEPRLPVTRAQPVHPVSPLPVLPPLPRAEPLRPVPFQLLQPPAALVLPLHSPANRSRVSRRR